MKNFIRNKDGVALVTSLMLTMMSLTIVMAVMYMIIQSTQQSGMMRRYKTALEASYGGTDIVMKEIVPSILANFNDANLVTTVQNKFLAVNLAVLSAQACFQNKLTLQTSEWGAVCNAQALTVQPKQATDFTFDMQALNGSPYRVYTKIIDTVHGNTDMSGLQLEGAGVAESQSIITPQHLPYVYRLEIQAERSVNAVEQGNMSIVYAY